MKKELLVSVITPCYNGETYVIPFLESVLAQEYGNVELIFVNDGSTDRTEEIALSYGKKMEERGYCFRYIYQENAGQAAAINKGLAVFSGEYMMWVDSDDIMLPNNISEKVRFLEENPQYGAVLAQGEMVRSEDMDTPMGILRRKRPEHGDPLFEDLIYERNVVFGPGTVMVRRETFQAAIPSGEIFVSKEGQNWQLMLPLAYQCQFGYLEKVLFKYVVRGNSHSHEKRDYNKEVERAKGCETLLHHTIDAIVPMSLEEKNTWKQKISVKYAYKRMILANENGKYRDSREAEKALRKLGGVIHIREKYIPYRIYLLCKLLGLRK